MSKLIFITNEIQLRLDSPITSSIIKNNKIDIEIFNGNIDNNFDGPEFLRD